MKRELNKLTGFKSESKKSPCEKKMKQNDFSFRANSVSSSKARLPERSDGRVKIEPRKQLRSLKKVDGSAIFNVKPKTTNSIS